MKQRGHADWTRIPTTRHSLIVSPNWPCPSEVSVQGNMKINNKTKHDIKSSRSLHGAAADLDLLLMSSHLFLQYNSLYYHCNTGIVRIVRGKEKCDGCELL